MPRGSGCAAIVIGGAVAKGAFAAGALDVLTRALEERRKPIRAILGTSSGALNATVLATGVRAGAGAQAAGGLCELWERDARFWRIFAPDLGDAVRLSGISSLERVVKLLAETCRVGPGGPGAPPVALRLVVTTLAGMGARTTFEHVERFSDGDFEDRGRRERMFHAAAASAAFPFAFAPVEVEGVGACVDGGVVNNTPIKEAIDQDPAIDTVYVVVADPPDMALPGGEAAALGGVALGLRLVEMLVNERLFRDLREARDVNRWIGTLQGLVRDHRIDEPTRDAIVRGLYQDRDPRDFREVDVVEIRPAQPLRGNPFRGFFDAELRREYVRLGRAAAERELR